MFTINPNPAYAQFRAKDLKSRLDESLDFFYKCCKRKLGSLTDYSDTFDMPRGVLLSQLEDMRSSSRIGIRLGFSHYLESLELDGVKGIYDAISQFTPREYVFYHGIIVDYYDGINPFEKKLIDLFIKDRLPENIKNLPISEQIFNKNSQALSKALDVLKAVDQELYGEITALIHHIIFTNIEGLSSSSCFELMGLVCCSVIEEDLSWVAMLEKVLHEAAHTCLFLLNLDDALVLNELNEVYVTPLRPDARPVYGIFHAYYVSLKILYLWPKIKAHITQSEEEKDYQHFSDLYNRVHHASHDVLLNHARFTPLGQEIFESCKNYAFSLSKAA